MVRISFLTCVFLIGLRLVIGWHFFFEGVNKYRSEQNEGAESYKPFSSVGYLAEAEGPLGPKMRDFLGDADQVALARLKLNEGNDDAARMPAPLATEWDAYYGKFVDFYKLNDEDKKKAEDALTKAKADYVLWLTDRQDAKNAKKKEEDDGGDPSKKWTFGSSVGVPGLIYRPEADVQQRVFAYQQFVKQVREDYEKVLRTMGNDVEKTRLRALKTATADVRRDLMKDVDAQTKKMKDSLAKVVGSRLVGYDVGKTDDPNIDDRVLAMVVVAGNGEATAERMPPVLNEQWDKYVETVKAVNKDDVSPRADEIVRDAKLRWVRYLLDRDPYTGAEGAAAGKDAVEKFNKAADEYEAAVRTALKTKADPKPLVVTVGFLSLTVPPFGLDPKTAEAIAGERAASFLRDPSVRNRVDLYKAAVGRLKAALDARDKETDAEKKKVEETFVLAVGRLADVPRQDFIDDIRLNTDTLRNSLGGLKSEKDADQFKGTVEQPKPSKSFLGKSLPATNQGWFDGMTRWTLLIAGGCLLIGLFTRLAALTCAIFLISELLFNPALPWLPTSPKMEGNYLFVNKNVVELFALLVLVTLPTGRWLGLDALVHAIFGRRAKTKA